MKWDKYLTLYVWLMIVLCGGTGILYMISNLSVSVIKFKWKQVNLCFVRDHTNFQCKICCVDCSVGKQEFSPWKTCFGIFLPSARLSFSRLAVLIVIHYTFHWIRRNSPHVPLTVRPVSVLKKITGVQIQSWLKEKRLRLSNTLF